MAVATNVIAGITGSASGGLIIALEAMGDTYVRVAAAAGIDPALMHRVVAIGCGGLSGLPHNGAVVKLLSVSGATHRGSYRDIAIVMAKTYGIPRRLLSGRYLEGRRVRGDGGTGAERALPQTRLHTRFVALIESVRAIVR